MGICKREIIMKNKLVGILICMLLILTVLPISGSVLIEKTLNPTPILNKLYVGGSGPNNFSSIQSAIDFANNGNTIYVYNDSSPYYENLLIDKPIILFGEDMNTTIIHGISKNRNVIFITSNLVKISGFTIQHSSGLHYAGIWLDNSDFCTIRNNIVTSNFNYGVVLNGSSFNNIYENQIMQNNHGIVGGGFEKPSNYNIIKYNNISANNNNGIGFAWSKRNILYKNIISDNGKGIQLHYTHKNIIYKNLISNNSYIALHSIESRQNNIFCNNIQNNAEDVYFRIMNPFKNNRFLRNYWNGPLFHPKLIYGELQRPGKDSKWVEIDWLPALEPYDI